MQTIIPHLLENHCISDLFYAELKLVCLGEAKRGVTEKIKLFRKGLRMTSLKVSEAKEGIHPSADPSTHLSTHHTYIYLLTHLSIYPSTHQRPSIYLSTHPSIHLSICPSSIYLTSHPSIPPPTHLSMNSRWNSSIHQLNYPPIYPSSIHPSAIHPPTHASMYPPTHPRNQQAFMEVLL